MDYVKILTRIMPRDNGNTAGMEALRKSLKKNEMEKYKHLTQEQKDRIIELGYRKDRFGLSDEELIEYYELLIKATEEGVK